MQIKTQLPLFFERDSETTELIQSVPSKMNGYSAEICSGWETKREESGLRYLNLELVSVQTAPVVNPVDTG